MVQPKPKPLISVTKELNLTKRQKLRNRPPPPPKFSRIDQTLLRVHHYLGAWESYNSRNDIRRSKDKYEEKGTVDFGSDDDIRPWISSFVDLVGSEKALSLLET